MGLAEIKPCLDMLPVFREKLIQHFEQFVVRGRWWIIHQSGQSPDHVGTLDLSIYIYIYLNIYMSDEKKWGTLSEKVAHSG